jgi:fatty-acyl-CoA synthase
MTTMQAEPTQPAVAANNKALRDWIRALEGTAPIAAHPQRLLYDVVAEMALAHGDAPALIAADSGDCLTYRALIERANRYACWALGQGLAKGDTVCLMMPNRPEYLAIWLGLSGAGVVVALINTELRGHSLAHCIDIVTPKHLIVAAECVAQLQGAAAQLMSAPKVWLHGGGGTDERIDLAIERCATERPRSAERPAITTADAALLIYTSGTTGLPKAARVSHRRLLQWSFWFAGLVNASAGDRMYDCLPMYHSVGGVVATGAMLVRGGAVIIRDRFSTRHFWDDVCDRECTVFQYIGELCRYLVNAPPHPRERAHRLRLCCGNGLQADVWTKFQDRFAVPRILEFYASTEGNVSLYNVEGKVGSIGRVPPFLASRFALALVQFDPATGRPARDEHGFCIRCAVNETGEALGRIAGSEAPGGEIFEGYTDRKDTEQKILHNVFAPGDRWFRTGDLMRMDAGGFYYFVDRIGDTFRWKGENVATSEVAAAIMAFAGITEANVYGVRVPGNEGAAGMAAIVPDGALDIAALRAHLLQRLPAYARPKFLRVAKALATTGTFKHTKGDLQREGFDPAATGDMLYFDDPDSEAYVPLDRALYARIKTGAVRV